VRSDDPEKERGKRIRAGTVPVHFVFAHDLHVAPERAEAPRLDHGADVVAERREVAVQFPAAIDEVLERFAFQLGAAAGLREDIEKEGRRVVVGDPDHLAQSSLDLGREPALVKRLDHEEELHERGRIEWDVAMIIGAHWSIRFRQFDDAEGKVFGGEFREIFQRCLRGVRDFRAERRVNRDSFEFPEIGESGSGRQEQKRQQEATASIQPPPRGAGFDHLWGTRAHRRLAIAS
jgi:hypothetical protein